MLKIKILLALFASFVFQCEAQIEDPVVSIICPRIIRRGEVFRCGASSNALNLKKPVSIDFQLSGTDEATNKTVQIRLKNQKIDSEESKSFAFDTKSFKSGKYQLTVNVTDNYKKKSYVRVLPLAYSKPFFQFLIQTDKPIYRPGDLIRFRVFAIDSDTKPYNVPGAFISILDSNSNVVATFTNITFVKGKYENSLQLSDNPLLNQWTLRASGDSEVAEKQFNIQDYVAPLYSLEIENPEQAAISDSSFYIKITPVYTFGKSVEGDAVVAISSQYQWWRGSQATILYTRTIHIKSGSETIEVRIKDDLGISSGNLNSYYLTISVIFTSTLTKAVTDGTSYISIVPFAYSMVFTGENEFKPNTNYSVTISLRKFDGRSAPAGAAVSVSISLQSNCVYMKGNWNCPNKNLPVQNYQTDATGSVVVQLNPGDYDYFYIQASSSISQSGYFYASKIADPFANQLSAKVLTKTPKIGSAVLIQVSTSLKKLDKCFYHVISKGVLLQSKSISFENQKAIMTFTPNIEYLYETKVIFFFYDEFATIVSTQVYLSLTENLPNFLELGLSVNTTEPGKNVSLCVSSASNSRASLLAIDQRVLLLAAGNDITKQDVINTMYKYGNPENVNYQAPIDERQFEYVGIAVIKFILEGYPKALATTTPPPKGTTAPSPDEPPFATSVPVALPGMQEKQNSIQGGSAPAAQPITVRKNFAEVFLWQDVDIPAAKKQECDLRGQKCFDFKAPDSITSYILSGISMNAKYGLGLPDVKPKLTVFLPFFIDAALPNNMKRGEVLMQDILLFNYLITQNVVITIKRNDKQYEFLDPKLDGWTVESDRLWQNLTSVLDNPISLRVVLRPLILGFVELAIEARGSVAGDSILKKMKVIPEGIPKSITNSTLIMKNQTISNITTVLTCTLPSSAVSDTTSALATIAGDLLGDTMSNLANLIQMSYGCGEQNLLNLVPNVIVLIYLTVTNQITPDLKATAISYARDGYQRELGYARNDGSFSAFGNSDPVGSTWLTAYCVKTFIAASQFFYIDQNVIQAGFNFILSKQNPDGSFREDGNVIHKDMQGGSSKGLAMTAYIVIILTEGLSKYPQYKAARDSGLEFIVKNLNVNDVYDMAISCYALNLANHTNFTTFYPKLLAMGIETADMIHWQKPTEVQDQNSWSYWNQPRSSDVEITSYVLLILANTDLLKGIKCAKYLVSQKCKSGGFASSQDTVVGIAALSVFSIKFHSTAGTLFFQLTPDLGAVINAQVNAKNLLALQTFVLNPLARRLNVFCSAPSNGTAIVSLTCNFYELQEETSPRFTITHSFVRSCKKLIRSRICISYVTRNDDVESNMALVKMTFPSGYKYSSDNNLKDVIRKIETVDDDTIINLYFNKFNAKDLCFDVPAIQTNRVENLKSSYIQVVDYYDTVKKAQIFYNVPEKLPECQDLPPEETTTTSPAPTDFFPIDGPILIKPRPMLLA